MTSTEQLIADLCDGDRRDPMDIEERASFGVTVSSDGSWDLERIDLDVPDYDPFERDQTYKVD